MNQSFIDISNLLTLKYVKNNEFMLELVNNELEDIDPYSDELTVGQEIAIMTECINNIWYFIREVIRIPNGETFNKFNICSASLNQIWCSSNGINTYTVRPEDEYNIDNSIPILAWEILCNIGMPGIVINNKFNDGYNYYMRLKTIIELLPLYLRSDITFTESLEIKRGDIVLCHVSPYSISSMNIEPILRENDKKISLYPNFEYMPVNTDLLTSLNKSPGYDIIISKPCSENSLSNRNVFKMIMNSCRHNDLFYDLDPRLLKQYILTHSKNNVIYNGYTCYGSSNHNPSIEFIHGLNGTTPIRGTDYWTNEDIETINTYIDNKITEILNNE